MFSRAESYKTLGCFPPSHLASVVRGRQEHHMCSVLAPSYDTRPPPILEARPGSPSWQDYPSHLPHTSHTSHSVSWGCFKAGWDVNVLSDGLQGRVSPGSQPTPDPSPTPEYHRLDFSQSSPTLVITSVPVTRFTTRMRPVLKDSWSIFKKKIVSLQASYLIPVSGIWIRKQ